MRVGSELVGASRQEVDKVKKIVPSNELYTQTHAHTHIYKTQTHVRVVGVLYQPSNTEYYIAYGLLG